MDENRMSGVSGEPEIRFADFDEADARAFRPILERFIHKYGKKPDTQSDQAWLKQRFQEELPKLSEEEAGQMSRETVEAVKHYNADLASLEDARSKGRTAEEWFAEKAQEAATGMSVIAFGQQLAELDAMLGNANTQMQRVILTQGGAINQQWYLDGFIAEQQHVNSFNAAAAVSDSPFHAEVCAPEAGQTYGKNSFDIVIRDRAGKIVHQYQSKYGIDAKHTIALIRKGNYNNQTLLVPPEQVAEVQAAFPGKTVVSSIGGSEKVPISSAPFSKADARSMQADVQEKGILPDTNWGTFDLRMLTKHIGSKAALAGVQGAAIATGFHLAARLVTDKPVEAEEVVQTALETGADAGVKAAAAGALKVAAENGVLKIIPPGTAPGVYANIACVSIENIKILSKVPTGELTMLEALDRMGCHSAAMINGLSWGAKGAVFLGGIPIVGPLLGGLVGGTIGYMAGSKVGQTVYEGAKKVVNTAKKVEKTTCEKIKNTGKRIANAGKRFLNKLFG